MHNIQYMERMAYNKLLEWKTRKKRKPLIIKGARQTGKTYLANEFGRREFLNSHTFNFQKNKDLHLIFAETMDPKKILKILSDYSEKKIDPFKDLLFFDEIQECPDALNSLKYFAEEMPSGFVIAAGSLLGLHLSDSSFPVGKIEYLNLYPLNFYEYLQAKDMTSISQYLDKFEQEIPEVIHKKLVEELRSYLIIGGLPEVVTVYLESENVTLVRQKQNELLNTYRADFAKHSGPVNALNIMSIFESIPKQLARDNKKFSMKLLEAGARYSKFKTAFEWLIGAGLCYKVPILDHVETPLKAFAHENSFKLYFLDVGLLGALSELPTNTFLIMGHFFKTFKGAFVENLFLQEFVSSRTQSLYCWQGRTSEVEFLFQNEKGLFPIEVKSGDSGKLRSLNVFAEKYEVQSRTRVSFRNYLVDKDSKFRNFPAYLSSKV